MEAMKRIPVLFTWLCLLLIALAANVWSTLEHYIAARNALELVGTEQSPLGRDPLMGELLSGVIPRATQPAAMALTIAVCVGLGLLYVVLQGFTLVTYLAVRHDASQAGDASQVRAANQHLLSQGLPWLASIVALGLVLAWEWHLFRFRTVASALVVEGVEATGQAAVLMGDTHLARLTNWGAWGYLACAFAAALMLEITARRAHTEWELFLEATAGGSTDPMLDEAVEPEVPAETVPGDAADATSTAAAGPVEDNAAEPPVAATPSTAQGPMAGGTEGREGLPVIGSEPPRVVSLAQALADAKRYHVDPEEGQVWDRSYWLALHATSGREVEQS